MVHICHSPLIFRWLLFFRNKHLWCSYVPNVAKVWNWFLISKVACITYPLVSLSMWRAQRHLPLSGFESVPYFNKSLCKHKIRCKKISFTLKESLFHLSHAYRRSFWSDWLFWRFKFSVLRYMIFSLNFLCPTEILTFSNFLTKICLEKPDQTVYCILDRYKTP